MNKDKIQVNKLFYGMDIIIKIGVPIMNLLHPIQYSPNQKYDNEYFLICLLDFTTKNVSWTKYTGTPTHPIVGKYLNQTHNTLVTNNVYEAINTELLNEYLKKDKEEKIKIQMIDSSFVVNKEGSVKNNNHLLNDNVKQKNSIIRKNNKKLSRKKKEESFIDYNRYNGRKKYFKVSTLTNQFGVPLGTCIISAKQSDSISVEETIKSVPINLNTKRNSKINRYKQNILLDAQYDSINNQKYLSEIGYVPIIAPNKRNTKDINKLRKKRLTSKQKKIYKKRMMIELFFSWIKRFPVINQNYEKTISSYKGLFTLASCIIISNNI